MENDKISIIVPVWNAHDYLGRCIESILNQTYRNLEIILVDDGSTDDSLEICNRYREIDNRVIVYHKENGGQGSARNYALDRCNGGYVGFVDNDDWIYPDMYKRLHELLLKYNADISRCDDDSNTDNRVKVTEVIETLTEKKEFHRYLYCDIWSGHVTDRLFRRELIGDFRFPASKTIEDMRFIRQLLPNVGCEISTNERLYYYTVREDNTSFRYAKTFINSYERAEEYQSRYEEAIEKYPDYLRDLLVKSTTFACGSMRILYNEKKKSSDEFRKMRNFLKKHKKEILSHPEIGMKYKFFVGLL